MQSNVKIVILSSRTFFEICSISMRHESRITIHYLSLGSGGRGQKFVVTKSPHACRLKITEDQRVGSSPAYDQDFALHRGGMKGPPAASCVHAGRADLAFTFQPT